MICVYLYLSIYLYLLFLLSLPPPPHPTPVGHYRAPSWAPYAIQLPPTSYLFYTWWCISVNTTLPIHLTPSPSHLISTCLGLYPALQTASSVSLDLFSCELFFSPLMVSYVEDSYVEESVYWCGPIYCPTASQVGVEDGDKEQVEVCEVVCFFR